MPAPKREKLLNTAESIFAKEGFKGVSIDRVLKEAGVAKMTLYKGFDSKNALIEETLRRRGDRLEAHIASYLDEARLSPELQILRVFDAMKEWSERPDFNGCYFVNALTEYGACGEDIGALARDYKERFLKFLRSLCGQLNADDPNDLSQILFLLLEGATVSSMSLGDRDSFARAQRVAADLLKPYSNR